MEDEKALQAIAFVCQLSHFVCSHINQLFPDGVMATSKIVGRILLSRHQQVRVEKLAIIAGLYFICKGQQVLLAFFGQLLANL